MIFSLKRLNSICCSVTEISPRTEIGLIITRSEPAKLIFKGKRIKILYGGSVNKKNAEDILSIDFVNGALIGGASLNYEDFKSILDFCN